MFTINKKCFLNSLQAIINIADKKHNNPILSNILFKVLDKTLFLTAFDAETKIVTNTLVSSSQNINFTLPAKKIFNIVRSLPDNSNIAFNYNEDNLHVTLHSGSSKFRLCSLNPHTFPTLNEDTKDSVFKISSIELLKLLKRVQFAMAHNDFRYFLNGMLWELDNNKFKVIATDGHRMACSATIVENIGIKHLHIIIPRKAILELQRTIINYDDIIEVQVGTNYFKLSLSNYQFTSKLIDASYPDYRCVIPRNNSKHVIANRNDLKQSLVRTSILSHELYRSVKLKLTCNQLFLLSSNPSNECAEDVIPIKYSGDDIELGFNIGYLLDVINVINTEIIELYFGDSSMSLLIKNKVFNSIYVISPIRL